jgi:hypothetical protein
MRQLEEETRPRAPWRSKARPRPRHRTAASTGSPKNNKYQAIGHSAGWGTAPLGRGWSEGLCRATRYEGDRPALEQQIGDVRAGRDVRRGFVNARADTRIPDAPADRQPATAAGQTGRGGPPTRRRANEAQTRDRATNGPALTGG